MSPQGQGVTGCVSAQRQGDWWNGWASLALINAILSTGKRMPEGTG